MEHRIENSRAQLGHSWGVKLLGAQLGHSWGTISGHTREKLVWAQLKHISYTFRAHISLGHSWGKVKVKVIAKVRN